MESRTKPIRQAARTLQTLRGTGKIYAGRNLIGEGRYTLIVQQEIVYAGSQPSAGVTDIKGTLVTVDGHPLEVGSKLTLRMEDGRTAAIVVTTVNGPAGMYGVAVSAMSKRPTAPRG